MKIIPKIILSLFLILFSFGQFQRIQLENNINFYLHDLVIFFWINYTFFSSKDKLTTLLNILKKINHFKIEILFLFIIVMGLILGVKNSSELVRPILYIVRIVSYTIFSLTISRTIQTTKNSISLKSGYLVAIFFILIWGILQYFLIPDVRFLSILGWDDHYYRLLSTQFDPAFAGMLFIIGTSYLLMSMDLFKKNKYFFYLFYFGLMYGVLLTFSRASYLSYVSLLFLNLIFLKKSYTDKKLIVASIVIFTLSAIFVPKNVGEGNNLLRTSTINSRIRSSKDYSIFDQKYQWLVGKGLFTNKNQTTKSNAQIPDNIFITVFTGTGIIGLSFFLLLISKWGVKLYRNKPDLFALTAALLIHSQFNNTFLQPFVLLMWLGGIGSLQSVSKNNF
jgi:hypothetical protein